ncbi:MAG: hypothetical protein R3321_03745 [Nitrososphaeraceae archaeon]|nr:hypothetical protein [Nitrososphaeraceae archaeon]
MSKLKEFLFGFKLFFILFQDWKDLIFDTTYGVPFNDLEKYEYNVKYNHFYFFIGLS